VSDLSREERFEIQRRGGEAHRLLQDRELMAVLQFIRDGAVTTAVHGPEPREREDARQLARAVDHLATELRTRLETALLTNQRDADARRYE
jgi:hypothetical protein